MMMMDRSQNSHQPQSEGESEWYQKKKWPDEGSIATSDRQWIHLKKLHELVGDV